MKIVEPWHSDKETYHHNNIDCKGVFPDADYVMYGTGDKPLCPQCVGLYKPDKSETIS